jgi:hypothetical protein
MFCMDHPGQEIYLGDSLLHPSEGVVEGGYVSLLGEPFYCIRRYDRMQPFFMSLVSSSDHWMFISSTGGLTAGRSNADNAVFPYYTDDRVSENTGNTGPLVLIQVTRRDRTFLWEPFSGCFAGVYRLERNLYKNRLGDKLVFEESNLNLGLTFRYAWRFSDRYGLVKTAWLLNTGDDPCRVSLLDGLQNLLPSGTTTAIQNTFSNLLNAYKRCELDPRTGLGLFSLSSTLTDLPEPSESLRATIAWQVGLEPSALLLSSEQVDIFRQGSAVQQEVDIRGRRGAYLVHSVFDLPAGAEKEWSLVVEVNQDGAAVASINNILKKPAKLKAALEADIARGSATLEAIVAAADGLQLTGNPLVTAHHFSNALFNTMRGGIFATNYRLSRVDLLDFIQARNRAVFEQQADFFRSLPQELDSFDLLDRAANPGSADLERLCAEYLPLTFGRRHGDPSRPWNRFSINLKKPDGTPRMDYQGNWRDIFQNWEALAWSYPEFVEQLICKFLNATTVDGYNPYRVTRDGIEWETPAPDDPWANIGYWGDHQIIYLEKLLEISAKFHPGRLQSWLDRRIFSHADVPYRLMPYDSLLADWYNTISFDRELDNKIFEAVKELGADGKLVRTADGAVFHVSLAEKLLILLLAKLVSFVPEGGIWMNTQRPEWNDGNNALVGKGLSVVTLGYLRRYVAFWRRLLVESGQEDYTVTAEVKRLFAAMGRILRAHQPALKSAFSDEERRDMMDELGWAGSDYRWDFYQHGLSGKFTHIGRKALLSFLALVQRYIDRSLAANVRPDHLYHAYNVLHLGEGRASVGHLYEMLEGQVAILSSGLLTCRQSLALLGNLRKSRMYRADQHSYMLYPDRHLPGFLQKNCISPEQVKGSLLIAELAGQGDKTLILRDEDGVYHFNGDFRNARDVKAALDDLARQPRYVDLVEDEADEILELFEVVFDHHSFTGRSGTFFAYEGLGSIYWHMVTKLLLAAGETTLHAAESGEPARTVQALKAAYSEIRKGLGFNKSPALYGAFPTDPYSHTPAGQGAKQPGMTGQVKEEILSRLAELGLSVEHGAISFDPVLLDKSEFLDRPAEFVYLDVNGRKQELALPAGSLAYTFCQVPVVYRPAAEEKLEVRFSDGGTREISGHVLEADLSRHVFHRDGRIASVMVFLRS